jgi:hypothetical protein
MAVQPDPWPSGCHLPHRDTRGLKVDSEGAVRTGDGATVHLLGFTLG